MKRTKIFLLIIGVFVVSMTIIVQILVKKNENQTFYSLPTPLPAHQIEQLNGLKIKWQLRNTFIPFRVNGPSMKTSNGKVYYLGSLGEDPAFRIIGLNEVDGSVFIKTDPSRGGTEFTVDDSALYIEKNISEITKVDLASKQQIWSQALGNSHSPCCFNIVNGELQSYWYPFRFFIHSAKDGRIIREVEATQDYMYRIEDEISYRRGGNSFLLALKGDGTILWQVDLAEYLQAPVFSKDAIYVRTGDRMGKVFAVDRASGKLRWQTEPVVISNLAVSNNRVYYLTYDGQLQGVNAKTGKIEKSAVILPADLYPITTKPSGYEVAYDSETHMVFLILGNSSQMIAFEE